MNFIKPQIRKLIERKDFNGLKQVLTSNPDLANEGITIPYALFCRIKAHPLHRICDGVSSGKIADSEAIELARIFLACGAHIDGDGMKDGGTPLLAAASLHAEQLGIFYIDNGADVHDTGGNDGASALHWAAYCGQDKLVNRLIEAGAAIDRPDTEHKSTPLGWALHALMTSDQEHAGNRMACVKLLLAAGADECELGKEVKDYLKTLAKDDPALQELLK